MKVSETIARQLNGSINKRTWGDFVYNAKVYGARGDGVANDTSFIQQAINDAAMDGGDVAFSPGTYITDNLTIPSNVTLWFTDGAKLSVNNGSTVTINGWLDAGLYQVFTGNGIVTGDIKNDPLFPQWWGASASAESTSGYIESGSNLLKLNSAIDFKDGQGVAIYHAGTACVLSTPSAPTTALGAINSDLTGITTALYKYQIAAIDNNGGVTAVSPYSGTVTNADVLKNHWNFKAYNTITWSATTGARAYAVYCSKNNGVAVLIAVTTQNYFDDCGRFQASPTNEVGAVDPVMPFCVPASPSSVSLAGTFVSKIKSGAGTTDLELTDNAITTISSSTPQNVSHDDTDAIQSAINSAKYARGGCVQYPGGIYIINRYLDSIPTGGGYSDWTSAHAQFIPAKTVRHEAAAIGDAIIRAHSPVGHRNDMSTGNARGILTLCGNTSTVSGLQIDGCGINGTAIFFWWTLHGHVEQCLLKGVDYGVENFGYGIMEINYNVTRCMKAGIFVHHGGDNYILHNDIYVMGHGRDEFGSIQPESGGCGIELGYMSSNTTVQRNTFNRDDWSVGPTIGVRISAEIDGIRDIIISQNEFCDFTYCVFGYALVASNIINVKISENHSNPSKNSDSTFVYLRNADNVVIDSNFHGWNTYVDFERFILSYDSKRIRVTNNNVDRIKNEFALLSNCDDFFIAYNHIYNTGRSALSAKVINLIAGTKRVKINNNSFQQSDTTYGQVGIFEENTCSDNAATINTFKNITTPISASGTNSNMGSVKRLRSNAPPVTGTFALGDIVENSVPTPGGYFGWICTTAGSPGTWKTFGAITP